MFFNEVKQKKNNDDGSGGGGARNIFFVVERWSNNSLILKTKFKLIILFLRLLATRLEPKPIDDDNIYELTSLDVLALLFSNLARLIFSNKSDQIIQIKMSNGRKKNTLWNLKLK